MRPPWSTIVLAPVLSVNVVPEPSATIEPWLVKDRSLTDLIPASPISAEAVATIAAALVKVFASKPSLVSALLAPLRLIEPVPAAVKLPAIRDRRRRQG